MQSRLALSATSESHELVPFNPHFNPYMTTAILETSFLTMSLKRHHLHAVSEIHDIYPWTPLGQRDLACLKDLSRSIHEATDPPWTPLNCFLTT